MSSAVLSPKELVARHIEHTSGGSNTNWTDNFAHDATLLDATHDPSTGLARIRFSLSVRPAHANPGGNLHGGCAASILDWATSLALAVVCRPGYWTLLGVSRSLSVTYLRPVLIGSRVLVEAEIVQVGRRMALLHGTIRRQSDGVVLVSCVHDKVNTDPPAEPESNL